MPQILHYPARFAIAQLRMYHPIPNPDVVFQRPFPNLLSRNSELGAARDGEGGVGVSHRGRGAVGVGCAGFVEDFLPYLVRDVLVPSRGFVAAAWGRVAAKVDVAVLADERQLEILQGVDVVVQGSVRVPGVPEAGAVRVDEGHDGREGGVMVDYVGEVGH